MAENIKRHLSHLKSSGGTAPEASDIILGEIAVGYKKDSEALYIKNSSEEVVTFSSDNHFGETIHYLTGTTGAAGGTNLSASWSGNSSEIKELYTGLCVRFIIPSAGHKSGDTLSINSGEKHAVYYNADTKLTTHYGAGCVLNLTYDADTSGTYYNGTELVTVQGIWRTNAEYYKDTDTDVMAYYIGNNQVIYKTNAAAYRYMLLLTKDNTTLTPVNTTSNTTGGTKTLTTSEFDPFGDILYKSSTATISANGAIPSGVTWSQYPINLAYSFNTTNTLVSGNSVYIVAVPQSNGKVKLHTSPISQTLPTTEDGLVYIYLGQAYSTTNIYLMNNHPVYEFKGGKLMRYVGSFGSMAYEDKTNYYTKDDVDDLSEITASALNDLQTNKLDVTAYTPTDLSNYYTKSETSGATELNEAFSGINQTIEGNEYVTSTALNYLQLSKLDATAYTPTDLSNYYTKSETSGSTQLTTKFNDYYTKSETSGASEISSAFTNYYTKDEIEAQNETVATAINYLNEAFTSKLDASAMTSSEKSGWNDAATKAPMYIYSAITSNINSFTSPIEGTAANINKQAHVLFHNVGSSEVTVTIPTTYKTPKNEAITLTIPVGGYAEVNCLVLASMIFVRAI